MFEKMGKALSILKNLQPSNVQGEVALTIFRFSMSSKLEQRPVQLEFAVPLF